MKALCDKLSNVKELTIWNKNDMNTISNEMDKVKQMLKKTASDLPWSVVDENVIELLLLLILLRKFSLNGINNPYRVENKY